jgi:hypothetical protein
MWARAAAARRSLAVAALLLSGAAAASDEVSFNRDIAPVLQARCAVCHLTGEEPPGGLALHAKASYRSLVGVQSKESPLLRVKPGAPEQSYMLRKLEGTHLDAGGTGVRMPMDAEPLDEATLRQFREWIAAGAPES